MPTAPRVRRPSSFPSASREESAPREDGSPREDRGARGRPCGTSCPMGGSIWNSRASGRASTSWRRGSKERYLTVRSRAAPPRAWRSPSMCRGSTPAVPSPSGVEPASPGSGRRLGCGRGGSRLPTRSPTESGNSRCGLGTWVRIAEDRVPTPANAPVSAPLDRLASWARRSSLERGRSRRGSALHLHGRLRSCSRAFRRRRPTRRA